MVSNDRWNCPGHGTVVESADHRFFMLYHAFNKNYDVFVGREGVIEELKVGADGWPVLHNATVANRPKAELDFKDDFAKDNKLNLVWQWPSKMAKPAMTFNGGLHLKASDENHDLGTFLGQYIKTVNFSISADVAVTKAQSGICFGGAIFKSKWPGELGGIGITASEGGFAVYNNLEGTYTVLKKDDMALAGTIGLKMDISANGKQIDFYYSKAKSAWVKLHSVAFDAPKYAPWGMGYRAGIVAKGTAGQEGVFKSFALTNN